MKRLREGEKVIISCESCEPEPAVVLGDGAECLECGGRTYQLRTEAMVVECCASILRALN